MQLNAYKNAILIRRCQRDISNISFSLCITHLLGVIRVKLLMTTVTKSDAFQTFTGVSCIIPVPSVVIVPANLNTFAHSDRFLHREFLPVLTFSAVALTHLLNLFPDICVPGYFVGSRRKLIF